MIVGISIFPNSRSYTGFEIGILVIWICYFRFIRVRVMAKPKYTKKFNGRKWPPLFPGTLIKRYKRFLADVKLKDGTLVNDGVASFPDALTARGLKHVTALETLFDSGHRCFMFYLIQRMDAKVFKPADHIDPEYGKGLRHAVLGGVEILVYDVSIDQKGIKLNRKIPCQL